MKKTISILGLIMILWANQSSKQSNPDPVAQEVKLHTSKVEEGKNGKVAATGSVYVSLSSNRNLQSGSSFKFSLRE